MKRIARISAAGLGAAAAFLACASLAWSQSSSTAPTSAAPTTQPQPSADRDGRAFRQLGERRFDGRADGMRRPGEWRRGAEMRPENFSEATPEEWKEIEAFMQTNSPERLKRLEDIGDDARQQGVRNMFAARYRVLQDLKEQDPELYQIRVARMPIEDKVFELGWRLTRKLTDNPKETKDQLRAQLRLLIKSRLDERAIHVRRLEKRLKADEQRVDELVEANLSDIAEERLPRDLRPQLPPRRDRRGDEDTPNTTPATPAGDP